MQLHTICWRDIGSESVDSQGRLAYHSEICHVILPCVLAVVISFAICWSPFHAQRLLATYTTDVTPTLVVTFTILTYISGVTYYLSATINPILYQLMSVKFRQAFKDTFIVCCKCLRESSTFDKEMSFHCDNSRYKISCHQQNKENLNNTVQLSVPEAHDMMDTKGEEAPGLVLKPIFNSSMDLIFLLKSPYLQSLLEWTEDVLFTRQEVCAVRWMFKNLSAESS
ncbi:pyrokinin-1 receptor [Trichonephila clavipes]|nr:pyrokinin-1 receptor [Trichonephila clavipes]